MTFFDSRDRDDSADLTKFLNPQQIDNQIRQAIQFCWLLLPPEKQTPDELESQIRRLVDRALRDFRDDMQSFFASGDSS